MKIRKILASLLALSSLALGSCDISGSVSISYGEESNTDSVIESSSLEESSEISSEPQHVDYTSLLKLDLNNPNRVREEVTVYNFVDGDTTHFNVSIPGVDKGILKARYLAIDTPESTIKVEEWGKTASLFTRSKLENACSIIIESDDTNWNHDSSGERYLVWVWYKTDANSDYRLLNLEIVQEGYSMAKNAASFEYGQYISDAYQQAIREKIHLFTDQKGTDPNYYYGDIQEISIKELRLNLTTYANTKVAFSGVVTRISGNTAYAEMYDADEELSYAMPIYMGFTSYKLIAVGNELRFVGTVEYYETGDQWQLSGLTYMAMKPNYVDNLKLISTDNKVNPTLISYDDIVSRNEQMLATYVEIKDLTVTKVYTTNNGGDSDGAMSLTCKDSNGNTVYVRTVVLYDDEKNLVTQDAFLSKNISVIGIFDKYDGEYQIRVLAFSNVEFN